MARKASLFKQTDITKAIKGARDGGLTVGRVEIEGQKIIVFAQTDVSEPKSEMDQWMMNNAR